ncbi:MAG: addiction module antitoxin RelB [Gammaproteobacteria bacterium]|nr:addiction module antitoxin RelB [Gammaproteobacteria bacterium]
MNTELERIAAEALKLNAHDREHLVEVLIDSLDQDGDPAPGDFGGFTSAEIQKSWLDEAERRVQLIRDGQRKTIPADEVLANVRERLKASRALR